MTNILGISLASSGTTPLTSIIGPLDAIHLNVIGSLAVATVAAYAAYHLRPIQPKSDEEESAAQEADRQEKRDRQWAMGLIAFSYVLALIHYLEETDPQNASAGLPPVRLLLLNLGSGLMLAGCLIRLLGFNSTINYLRIHAAEIAFGIAILFIFYIGMDTLAPASDATRAVMAGPAIAIATIACAVLLIACLREFEGLGGKPLALGAAATLILQPPGYSYFIIEAPIAEAEYNALLIALAMSKFLVAGGFCLAHALRHSENYEAPIGILGLIVGIASLVGTFAGGSNQEAPAKEEPDQTVATPAIHETQLGTHPDT